MLTDVDVFVVDVIVVGVTVAALVFVVVVVSVSRVVEDVVLSDVVFETEFAVVSLSVLMTVVVTLQLVLRIGSRPTLMTPPLP